jgi:HEAT repeat protein
MNESPEIPFSELLGALLDEQKPLSPKYLYRLSDLAGAELDSFQETWEAMPLWRRQALLEDLEELGISDTLLSFESIGRYAISDSDPRVRLLAVKLLWEFDQPDLIQIYINLLNGDPEPEVRAAAAVGLSQYVYLGEIEAIPSDRSVSIEDQLLRSLSEDPSPLVRQRALESLSYSCREELPELIERAFESGDPEWIASALLAMGRSADNQWNDNVLSMLNNKSPRLRSEAAKAAGELEIKSSIPYLVDLTEDINDAVRSAAIWSLSQIGGERARKTLETLLTQLEEEDEIDFLETALENLAFTEGTVPFTLLELDEDAGEAEVYKRLITEESDWGFEDDEDAFFIDDEYDDSDDDLDFDELEENDEDILD